ncbi:uncharacterized protein LOC123425190 [Hordeum vulgare subsp. vulgare]|uniref:uncharacterized protein LOC123425190 n=1 Tax=Hordeum vulgare subsp. vulgare TaxID=112509 RepID=UPI001D1A45ED|nr:uncharacterized protein LOC123425190 [Hordeum vulgare subsp. vulgare]
MTQEIRDASQHAAAMTEVATCVGMVRCGDGNGQGRSCYAAPATRAVATMQRRRRRVLRRNTRRPQGRSCDAARRRGLELQRSMRGSEGVGVHATALTEAAMQRRMCGNALRWCLNAATAALYCSPRRGMNQDGSGGRLLSTAGLWCLPLLCCMMK